MRYSFPLTSYLTYLDAIEGFEPPRTGSKPVMLAITSNRNKLKCTQYEYWIRTNVSYLHASVLPLDEFSADHTSDCRPDIIWE